MPHTVRLATADDLAAILAISNHYARTTPANFAIEPERLEDWQTSFHQTHKKFPWLVACDKADEIIGFAKASPWKGRCAYTWSAEITVYVEPDAHGQGVGRELYMRLIDTLRRQGYRTLLGGITQPNVASVRLHESLGFKQVALLERVGYKFGRWHDVGYWELILADDDSDPTPIKRVCDIWS